MTKEPTVSKKETLTKQWKNRRLKTGHYYFKTKDSVKIGFIYEGFRCPYDGKYNAIDDVVEVLAPVPTYKEFFVDKKFIKDLGRDYSELMNQKVELLEKIEKLEKQLDIATKTLSCVYDDMKLWTFISKRDAGVLSVISKALKEIDEVLK